MKTWIYFADLTGNRYTFFVAIIGNLLSFFTGISLAWSSPVLAKLNGTDDNPLGNPITGEQYDLIGSLFSIGGAIGPLVLIYNLEKLGRKGTLTVLATLFPITFFTLVFSKTIYLYYFGRILMGICVGGSFSVVPVYISEIVSVELRGSYMSLSGCFILTGCLFSYCVGPYASILTFNLIIAISSFLYIPLLVLFCPESLYFSMQKHGELQTLEILQKLRRNGLEKNELEDIKSSVFSEKHGGSFFDIFRSRAGAKAFYICTILLILQQFTGINVIITYTQAIFKDAKVFIAPELCSIIFGAFQTATCLITPVAASRYNRKFLMALSFAGISVSIGVLGAYFAVDYLQNYHWLPLVSLVFYVIFYNCGVGSLPWVISGELYPLNVKSVGTASTTSIYWIVQFILTYFFNKIDMATSFLVFSGICLFAIVFVKVFVIETKDKTLQDIQRILEK